MGMDMMQMILLEQERKRKEEADREASMNGFDPPPPTYEEDPGTDDPNNAQPQNWQNSEEETGEEVDDVDIPREDENLFAQVHAQDILRDPVGRRRQEYEEEPNPLTEEERTAVPGGSYDPDTDITSEIQEGTQPGLSLRDDPPSPLEEKPVRPRSRQEDFFEKQDEWMSRRPDRDNPEYKASTGRKLLAALAGGLIGLTNPGAGVKAIGDVVHAKYNRAREDWGDEGKTLGDVGELLQKGEETKRKYRANNLTYEAAMDGIKQRREAETTRHADRINENLTDKEKLDETEKHNRETEAITREQNIIDQQNADSRSSNAESYKSRTDSLNKQGPKRPGYSQQADALMDSILEGFKDYPDAERFFQRNPRNKMIVYPKPNDKLSPEDLAAYHIFMKKAKKDAQAKLQGTDDVDEDIDLPYDFELPSPSRKRAIP